METGTVLTPETAAIQAELARIVRARATGTTDGRCRRFIVLRDHVGGWSEGDVLDLTDEGAIEPLRDHTIAPYGRDR